jgi:hypothetical protein
METSSTASCEGTPSDTDSSSLYLLSLLPAMVRGDLQVSSATGSSMNRCGRSAAWRGSNS